MKRSSLARTLALAATLLTSAFAIQPSTSPLTDAIVTLNSNPSVSHGMSRETVDFMLGRPDARLSPDVWVYWNFKARGIPASAGVDTLIVQFTDDRVTLIRLSKSEPVRAFMARQKARALEQNRAAQ